MEKAGGGGGGGTHQHQHQQRGMATQASSKPQPTQAHKHCRRLSTTKPSDHHPATTTADHLLRDDDGFLLPWGLGMVQKVFYFLASTTPQGHYYLLALVFALLLFVRLLIAIHPHSGAGLGPMYGDYEAQRHWMEITYNLPVEEWYNHTENNNLQYWGLDYPPLTAYHSYLMACVGHFLEPASMTLHKSRGYETPSSKLFMRSTVLFADVFIFLPALYMFICSFHPQLSADKKLTAFLLMGLQPALLLIDHGHFQYNNVSLGITLWSCVCIMHNQYIGSAILFSLALNYKQMCLYYAPVFFIYLLAVHWDSSRKIISVLKIMQLGFVVIGTFALVWLPFLQSYDTIAQVVHRLFPVARGLYEDKVANLWCALSPILKLKAHYDQAAILQLWYVQTSKVIVTPNQTKKKKNTLKARWLRS
eukprot:TRINITY_DN2229_c0_g1_i1.p1 TRINITY_DN2229_c0_g1~~TRINITY_DN2229_c0_g1_i1.p1  ORF type:complete len:419 (+),score=42.23 TRINITY_DN2229_c0_g1_i1:237-1493(+)